MITPDETLTNPLDHHFTNNNVGKIDFYGSAGKTAHATDKVEHYYINQHLMDSNSSLESPSRDFDTESLHFEAQIDSELAALDEIPSEDLDTQITLPSSIRNSVSESTIPAKPLRRLYGRMRDSGQSLDGTDTVDGVLSHNADHVSCEDLLEFADSKPSSRERGNESDEVRIMSKVLGAQVS